MRPWIAIVFVTLAAAAPARAGDPVRLPDPPASVATGVRLETVAKGLRRPVLVTFAPGDASGRLFVVEQHTGQVRILRGGVAAPKPLVDLGKRISKEDEQGLLGLAFHPRFAENGRFYLNYTDRRDHSHVVEFKVKKDKPDEADPGSEREILFLEQPYPNHNGGHLAFGPDGKLYAGFGDGGDRMDPHGNGQNRSALLAKMLRLDVDAGGGKGKPRPEIVMLGLRNPWRYSFDRKTGDLYIGDVGQDHWEEVDVVAAADVGKGKNFGWNVVEGMGHCARKKGCDQTGLVPPVAEYNHETGEGCSVTGGFVYRGKAIPELDGAYFYADYCTALIRSFRWKAGKIVDHWDWRPTLDPKEKLGKLASWGEDADGELYLVSLDGTVQKLVRAK